jgi:putative ABC transport system ATP-binding protein
MNDATVLLALDDVEVRAGDRLLLTGITLRLERGELVAVTGPSGSGKSTLLRTVAGLVGTGAGVRWRGRPPATTGWPDYRRHVVLVDQRPVLFDASVGENLARPCRYRHVDAAFDADGAASLLADLGLRDVTLANEALRLSVGQQQRVALARALLMAPDVLLLDEPTSALDADSVRFVEDIVASRAARAGLACLVVTHSVEQARRWCRRQIDLRDYARPDAQLTGREERT